MDIQEYLKEPYFIHLEIQLKHDELKRLEMTLNHLQSVSTLDDIEKERLQSEIKVCKHNLITNVVKLVTLKDRVIMLINKIDNPKYRTILILRYVKFYRWKDIAKTMVFNEHYCIEVRNKALKELKQLDITDVTELGC